MSSRRAPPVTGRPAPREIGDLLRRLDRLAPRRIERILLLANRHDAFVLDEDGVVQDATLEETLDVPARDTPFLVRYSTVGDAIDALAADVQRLAEVPPRKPRFDLVVGTMHTRDLHVADFVAEVRRLGLGVPVVLLAFDARELAELRSRELPGLDRLWVWQGDHRILRAIVRSIEDRWNIRHDTDAVGVGSIVLVEDSVRYYSAFLPKLFDELDAQSRRALSEGTSGVHRMLRMRARPRILHATTFEEAEGWFRALPDTILGLITDADFPQDGVSRRDAGLDLARRVRATAPDMPVLIQTSDPELAAEAGGAGFRAILKGSPTLLEEVSAFLHERVGFGDFVFRAAEGPVEARARNLHELEDRVRDVSDEALHFRAVGNHFSRWLRVRTEFGLADDLRPRRAADFASDAAIRSFVADAIRDYRRERQCAVVSEFGALTFEPETSFARIGGGSLGGKARGLALARRLLHEQLLRDRFPEIRIVCPSAVVIGTDVFDEFLTQNDLRDRALCGTDDAAIEEMFLGGEFPAAALAQLREHLAAADYPLAVRSSSLLEDSQRLPFAGLYETYVVPNSDPDPERRLADLTGAVRRVWASTYRQSVKAYVGASPYRLEEEKMAVLVQRLAGARHGDRFYPDFAGVLRSHDFYPAPPVEADDGVCTVALGLGHTVVEGGRAMRFCPRYPRHAIPSSPELILPSAQTEFRALDLSDARAAGTKPRLGVFGLEAAAADGTLARCASTWLPADDRICDGLRGEGIPVVTFAPILRGSDLPLADVASTLIALGKAELELPVEMEFAVTFPPDGGRPEFAVVQMRPFAVGSDHEQVDVSSVGAERCVVRSSRVLGNGRIEGIADVVLVRRDRFERRFTREVAADIASVNGRLLSEGRPYVLVGMGRWGSSDPWLGIPVSWEQIRGARVIVETGLPDLDVVPSQGSHFFHNLTAANMGYLTVAGPAAGTVDWDWLESQPYEAETAWVRHVRLGDPLLVLLDGRTGNGAVVRG